MKLPQPRPKPTRQDLEEIIEEIQVMPRSPEGNVYGWWNLVRQRLVPHVRNAARHYELRSTSMELYAIAEFLESHADELYDE